MDNFTRIIFDVFRLRGLCAQSVLLNDRASEEGQQNRRTQKKVGKRASITETSLWETGIKHTFRGGLHRLDV
jgi:hypothetical protein